MVRISVLLLSVTIALVLYRLSTSGEKGTLYNKGRRLSVHVGWAPA